jgi:ketosteroid isomerase-like protein
MKTACGVLVLLLVAALPATSANEADADRGKLIALENAWNQAQMQKDVSAVEQLLAPMFIYTDYDGLVQDKKKFLDDLKDPAYHATSMTNEDAQVFPYHNAAVVVGTYHAKGTYKGKAFEHRGRFTDTWLYQDGKWMCVASHISLIKA